MAPHSSTLAWKIAWMEEPGGLQSMGSLRVGHDWATSLSLFHFLALEKEMATHSSVLAWRIPGMGDPGGLTSMGSHRVGHDWRDLAAAATHHINIIKKRVFQNISILINCFYDTTTNNNRKVPHPSAKINSSIVTFFFAISLITLKFSKRCKLKYEHRGFKSII